VLGFGGGGINALGRQAVAALLDASDPDVDYPLSAAEVISLTQAALDSGDPMLIENTKDEFDTANNGGCPLS
jgi:hypothetical protein